MTEAPDDTRQTMADAISRLGLTMTASPTDKNPNMIDSTTPMDHWLCLLVRKDGKRKRTMRVRFSMGIGHEGRPPELADVLDCLASDAVSIENARSFEDWAADLGYDTDSIKALRTYRTCQREARRLHAFVGSDEFQKLLFQTERL